MADSEERVVEVVEGEEDGVFGDDSPAIIKRILKLKDQQDEMDLIDAEYRSERLIMETKYRALKAPFLVQRTQYVLGMCDVDGEPNGASESDDGPAEEDTIPMFWLKAMMNHEVLSEAVQEHDFGALACLQDVTMVTNENMDQYTLTFHFKENEWFENEVLVKTYKGIDLITGEEEDEQGIEGTQVEWKEGKNLLQEVKNVKQKSKSGKRKGEVRYVERTVARPSFFHYFSDPVPPVDEEDEEAQEAQVQFDYEQDFEIGESFRMNLLPNAINWFTGEAADDEDDEDYEESDEDDDEDEDEDSSGAEEVGGLEPVEGGGFAAAPAAGDKPECKQS